MSDTILIIFTLLLVGGIVCQLLAHYLRLPAIVFLLLGGFVAGPVTGVFDPDALFGDMLFPIVSLGVAVILFEGALTLRFEDIKSNVGVIWRLVTIGAVVTLTVGAFAAHYLGGVNWNIALLFGAIITVTGPTVIMPLLRAVRPSQSVANILRWEGIVIDPLGAIFAVIVFTFIGMDHSGEIWNVLARLLVSGAVLGTIYALFLAFLLRHHMLPEYLTKIFILAYVIGVYTMCDLLQHESGLLAVTIMGIVLANTKDINIQDILDFKESLSILIISGLFLILSARMDLDAFAQAGWSSLWVLAAVIILGRPLCIFVSTVGSNLKWKERALLAWIAPRGIIAAAIAPLFALKLEKLKDVHIENVEMLTSLVFVIIIGTVVIQSFTAAPLARLLGAAEPEARGVLIIGADKLARTIAKALKNAGFPILLTSTDRDAISAARMEGLPTYHGNAISEHAERKMDLMGIGKLLGISSRPTDNALAAVKFRREFGAQNVFLIKTDEEQKKREQDRIADNFSAPFLFGGNITQKQLLQLIEDGREIRATPLTEEFGFEDYMTQNKGDAIPLFGINKKGSLVPFIDEETAKPEAGWTVLSLLPMHDAKNGK